MAATVQLHSLLLLLLGAISGLMAVEEYNEAIGFKNTNDDIMYDTMNQVPVFGKFYSPNSKIIKSEQQEGLTLLKDEINPNAKKKLIEQTPLVSKTYARTRKESVPKFEPKAALKPTPGSTTSTTVKPDTTSSTSTTTYRPTIPQTTPEPFKIYPEQPKYYKRKHRKHFHSKQEPKTIEIETEIPYTTQKNSEESATEIMYIAPYVSKEFQNAPEKFTIENFEVKNSESATELPQGPRSARSPLEFQSSNSQQFTPPIFNNVEKSAKNDDRFPAFGSTLKTITNFFKFDNIFGDIVEPNNNIDEQPKSTNDGLSFPKSPNLYSLVAEASNYRPVIRLAPTPPPPPAFSLSNLFKPPSSNYQVRIGSLTKRDTSKNSIKKSKLIPKMIPVPLTVPLPIVDNSYERQEQRQQIEQAMNNFKTTMKILSHVDMYISSMLKSYIKRLARYADDKETML